MDKKNTRFAPSPTGMLHIGGLRTALFSYLIAKKSGGNFTLRIEDTDQERTVEGGIKNIIENLNWASIIPDEGVFIDENNEVQEKGINGPYIQSKRLDIYKKHTDILVEKGCAYHCFCTEERLSKVRLEKQEQKLPPGYDGFCRNLTQEEVEKKIAEKTPFVIRMKMPEEGESVFVDQIRGEVSFKNKDVDDQVILKSDGFPTYHLAVVVDDHFMNINYVVRGEEWISSTPKHLFLYESFGWEAPLFAHLPLILNPDKSKLSKRQGDTAVSDYKDKGYLPSSLINFVAFLGWNPGNEREIFNIQELIEEFSVEKVGKAGAVFNLEKLNWYNREYMKELKEEELLMGLKKYLPDEVKNLPGFTEEKLTKIVPIIIERISVFSEIQKMTEEDDIQYFFEKPKYEKELLVWKNDDILNSKKHLEKVFELLSNIENSNFNQTTVKSFVWDYAEKEGRGNVLWPLRVALSGKNRSPDPFTLSEILGKDETLERISDAIKLI